MAKKSNPIESFVVFDNDGRVDVDATMDAVTAAVNDYAVEAEATQTLVMGCLNELFDDHKGARIAQTAIVNKVVSSIQRQIPDLDDVSRYPALVRMVNGVIQAQVKSGYLNVARGISGGTGRSVDCPVKESAAAIKAAAKAAKMIATK